MLDDKLSFLLRAFFEVIVDLLPYLAVIVVIILFCSAVSLQLFHGELKMAGHYILPTLRSDPRFPSPASPLINFDTFINSVVSFGTFVENEEWHLTMYNLMLAGHSWTIAYFLVVVIFGEFILMKLFLVTYINSYLQKVNQYNIIVEDTVDKTKMEDRMEIALKQKSLWCMAGDWKLRQAATIAILHPYYKRLYAFLLVVYVVLLVLPNSTVGVLPLCYALDALFAIDMLLNIVVFKFYGEYSYTSSGLNILELAINVLVLISSFTSSMDKVIRAVRACRIMRVINYFRSLHILMVSIVKSVRLILRLVLFLLTFLLLFGCVALKQFKGSTYSCSVPEYTSKTVCMDYGADWTNQLGVGFDDIVSSMFNIFAVITSEGWLVTMNVIMGSQGVDQAVDLKKPNQYWGLFFIPVFFIGNYLFINIFVGVLIEKVQTVSHAYD